MAQPRRKCQKRQLLRAAGPERWSSWLAGNRFLSSRENKKGASGGQVESRVDYFDSVAGSRKFARTRPLRDLKSLFPTEKDVQVLLKDRGLNREKRIRS